MLLQRKPHLKCLWQRPKLPQRRHLVPEEQLEPLYPKRLCLDAVHVWRSSAAPHARASQFLSRVPSIFRLFTRSPVFIRRFCSAWPVISATRFSDRTSWDRVSCVFDLPTHLQNVALLAHHATRDAILAPLA